MTEEIINSDGSRNWQANILLDNIKRLEQENKELKEMLSKEPKAMQAFQMAYSGLKKENEVLWGMVKDYKSALEEIREVLKFYADTWVDEKIYPNLHYDNTKAKEGLSRINEVLNDN